MIGKFSMSRLHFIMSQIFWFPCW